MNKEILKWYLNYIDNKKLNEILSRVKLNIKGFSSNRKIKNKSIIPSKFAIKNILEDEENYERFTQYLFAESFLEMDEVKDNEIIDLLKEGKEVEEILKFLVGSNEDAYLEEKEYLLEKIKSGTLNLEEKEDKISKKNKSTASKSKSSISKVENQNGESLELEEESIKAEKTKNDDINKLKKSLTKLESSNEKLNIEIRKLKEDKKSINYEKSSLNKQINVLTQEVNSLKRKLETSQSKESKSNENYINLKNKYDELIKKERELLKENKDLTKESNSIRKKEDELKEKNRELAFELENIKKMLEKVSKEKIAIIGDIEKIHLKGSDYEFKNIEFKNINNLDDLLQDYEEVWVTLYELSSLEQSKILRAENNYKVFKFKTFEEVKNHINNGR